MKLSIFLVGLISVPLSVGLVGCTGGTSKQPAAKTGEAPHEEHASHGPHGGQLIELGEEEFHAELVHDEKAGVVTIYVLDGTAKASAPIASADLTINLKHEGKGEQFKLAASPDAGDPPGKSSRFVSSEAELAKDLDTEGVVAQLAVTVNGKPYNAAIEHHHD